MNRAAFFTAYRAMLFEYAPWAKDIGALESYMAKLADSIEGRAPHYEIAGSVIAQATWERLWQEGEVSNEKLRSLL